jgi:hypothetical protein
MFSNNYALANSCCRKSWICFEYYCFLSCIASQLYCCFLSSIPHFLFQHILCCEQLQVVTKFFCCVWTGVVCVDSEDSHQVISQATIVHWSSFSIKLFNPFEVSWSLVSYKLTKEVCNPFMKFLQALYNPFYASEISLNFQILSLLNLWLWNFS